MNEKTDKDLYVSADAVNGGLRVWKAGEYILVVGFDKTVAKFLGRDESVQVGRGGFFSKEDALKDCKRRIRQRITTLDAHRNSLKKELAKILKEIAREVRKQGASQ